MRLRRTDVVAGLPASDARDLLRWTGLSEVHSGDVAGRLEVTQDAARRILQAAQAEGFLEPTHVFDGEQHFVVTIRGSALAQASFGRPMRRGTAERLLTETLDRVRTFNLDVQRFAVVETVTVFGSFLDPAVDELGDLDLAMEVRPRHGRPPSWPRDADHYAATSGRSFSSLVGRQFWWQHEPVLYARNRSAYVNITTTDRHQLVFRRTEGTAEAAPQRTRQGTSHRGTVASVADRSTWDQYRPGRGLTHFIAPPPERDYAPDGRVLVPAERPDVQEQARLGVLLDVLHKLPPGQSGGPYGWVSYLAYSGPHAPVAQVRHDLDVPFDAVWLDAHAVVPDDLTVSRHPRYGAITIPSSTGWDPEYVIQSGFRPEDWASVGWRAGEPWDGTRPVVRRLRDRLLGRPGRRVPPFSSDPTWTTARG